MVTHEEVKGLLNYVAQKGVAISFYVNTDVHSKDAREIEAKDLIKNARRELAGMNINRTYFQAAEENLDQIRNSVSLDNHTSRYRSTAIFANSAEKFCRIYRLPVHVKPRLVIDNSFYVRPLYSLLAEHYRIGVALVDSKHARFFEVFIGEILEHLDFATPAMYPKKPFLETFMKREKRLAQRKEEETRSHLSSIADLLKTHFSMQHFEKLVIGAKKPLRDQLLRFLHPRLYENVIGYAEIDIHSTESEILSRVSDMEREFELRQESKFLRRIMNELERDGCAVKGLKSVIEALQDHGLREVVVADDFSQPGSVCRGCGMPYSSEIHPEEIKTCVSCGERLTQVADVVCHVIEQAVRQNAVVRHIRGSSLICSLENIAAVTKFKKSEIVNVEEAAETEF